MNGLSFQSLWRDEVDSIQLATRPWPELLHSFSAPGQNGPLYFLVLRGWLGLTGHSEFALRFFSVLFGVLAVPLIYRLARHLFAVPQAERPALQEPVSLMAALLASTSPYLLWYAQEGKMYSAVIVIALLSMSSFLVAVDQGGWHRWLVYVLVTTLAFYVHLLAALLVPAQLVIYFVLYRRHRFTTRRGFAFSLAALTVPYLPLIVWELPMLMEPAHTGYSFVPLGQLFASLLSSYSLGVAGQWTWPLLVPTVLLAVAGLVLVDRKLLPATVGVLGSWVLVPVLGLFLVSFSRPMYAARYLIFILPALLLLVAAGAVAVAQRSRLLAGLLLLALLAVNGRGLWFEANTPIKADLRAATRYVSARLTEGDLIVFQIPHARYSFDYYLARSRQSPVTVPIRWAAGLYTNGGMSPGEVDRRMAETVQGSKVVWLVATEVPMWDSRDLVRSWLGAHGVLTDQVGLVRVTVLRYEFR